MYILNLAEPYAILIALAITVLFIFLGRKFKTSILPALVLIVFLVLVLIHAFQLTVFQDIINKSILSRSMCVDALMILLSYISYLWIDDIEAKEKNKKSIDNSLDWFWKKI